VAISGPFGAVKAAFVGGIGVVSLKRMFLLGQSKLRGDVIAFEGNLTRDVLAPEKLS
jgi:hypothetical protein